MARLDRGIEPFEREAPLMVARGSTTQNSRKAIRMFTAGPAAITTTRFQVGWL